MLNEQKGRPCGRPFIFRDHDYRDQPEVALAEWKTLVGLSLRTLPNLRSLETG